MDQSGFDEAKNRLFDALRVYQTIPNYFLIEFVDRDLFIIYRQFIRDSPPIILSWETQKREIYRIITFCEQTGLLWDLMMKDLLIELHSFLQRVEKVESLVGTDWTGIKQSGALIGHTNSDTWKRILEKVNQLYSSLYYETDEPWHYDTRKDGPNRNSVNNIMNNNYEWFLLLIDDPFYTYSFSPDLMDFDPVDLDQRIRKNEQRALQEVPELFGTTGTLIGSLSPLNGSQHKAEDTHGGKVEQVPSPTFKTEKHHRTERKAEAVKLIIKILEEWKPEISGKKISFSGVFIPEIADRYEEQRGNRQTVSEPTLRGYFYETGGNVPELIAWRIQHKHFFDRE